MLPSPSLDQSGNRAANNDLRASEEFVLLEAEIGKLASVHADQAPDWQQVQTLGAHLMPLGHDLHVSCWYSLSCLQLQGCSGLVPALQALETLITHHWASSQPPRLRGRLAALSWLHCRLAEHPELAASQKPLRIALRSSMKRLASALRAIDNDQSDSWQHLAQQLDSAAPAEQEPAQVPASQAPSAAPVASAVDNSVINSEREAQQRLKHLQDCAAPLLQWWLGDGAQEHHAINLTRTLIRASLSTLPSHNAELITQLRPPPPERVNRYTEQLHSGDPRQLLYEIENSLRRAPFWLDGHHLAWQCCQAISASNAADQLRLQLQQLLRDLPGLEHLRFSDGTPFASQTTRQWIASTPAAAPEATTPHDDASPVEILQRNGFAAAAAELQRQVQSQPGERPRVIARLELARLHLHNGQADQARALLECIRQQLQASQALALWEPRLLIDTLRLLQQSSASLPRDKTSQQALQQQLAWLDIEHTLDQAARPALQGEP